MEKFNLRGHQKKCRCCFQSFHRQQKHLKITEDVKANFFSVTQIELKSSDCYSDEICLMCVNELTNFVEFKNKIAERQLELYKKFPDTEVKSEEPEIDIFQVNIKQEPEAHFSDNEPNFDGNFEILCESLQNVKEPPIESTPKRSKGVKTRKVRRPTKSKSGPSRLCPDCGKYVRILSTHRRRVHSGIVNFICDYCNAGFLLRNQIENHILQRHKPELCQKVFCHLCSFSSVYKSSLRWHLKEHKMVDKTHECRCGKSFKNKYRLSIHIKVVHEGVKNYKCSFCPKAYSSRPILEEHVLINHSKKDIRDKICEICAKDFITDDQLRGHMRTMHVEGKISCEFQGCDKKFHKMSRLHRHMLSHVNVKNHNCDKCSAVFTHRTELNKHNQAHHLGLRYRCQVPGCSIEYMKQYNYKVHLKKSHSNLGAEIFEKFMAQARTMKPN